jgi:MOSC domain-containing protein YiiM
VKGKVVSVNRSEKTGTKKIPVTEGRLVKDFGLEGDAHGNRSIPKQVSLLSTESIQKMHRQGFRVGPGDFAENLTVEGMELCTLKTGARLQISRDIILEITQIGKACHGGCSIFKEVGRCIMPREGVFARVLEGGDIRPGDEIQLVKEA